MCIKDKAQGLSSNQFIHFVKKEEYLLQILNHNFYPRLCCEDAIKTLFKSDVHVPMKCFCDIPLDALKNHMLTYGEYGVGFKKAWGEKIGLTPVIYYNENSPYIEHIKKVYNAIIERLEKSEFGEERSKIVEEICMLKNSFTMYKPIKGKYKRRLEYDDNYYFYDEREWRYILSETNSIKYLQGNNLDQKVIAQYNGADKEGVWKKGELEEKHQINFTYDDIEFVIVPYKCDIVKITQKLDGPKDDVEKIKKKITTLKALIDSKS